MRIEVHAPQKPTLGRRPLIATLTLLIITSLLAVSQTKRRDREPLAMTLQPPGWAVTFESPPRFSPAGVNHTKLGVAYRFLAHADESRRVMIMVLRVQPGLGRDASAIGHRILNSFTPRALLITGTARESRTDVSLGPLPAHEIWDPSQEILVRVGMFPDGDAYAVVAAADVHIDREVYETFERTCDTFALRED